MNKKHLIFFVLTILLFCAFAAGKEKMRHHPNSKFSPPGTIWLEKDLFLDMHEITNFNWAEYHYWIKKFEREKLSTILPDTNLWIHPEFSYVPFEYYYHRLPAYRHYPAVGVSHRQAMDFCAWRTRMVNHYLSTKLKLKKREWPVDSLTTAFVEYRLPSREEWETAAYGELNRSHYPYGHPFLMDPKSGKSLSWTRENRNLSVRFPNKEEEPPTAPADYGLPNQFGYKNLLGNVSEWLSDGTAIGLHFNDLLRNEKNQPQPANTIRTPAATSLTTGLRCICEVKKFPW